MEPADRRSEYVRKAGAMKLSATLMRSAIVAALGGLLFGFDTAVISGTTEWLKREFMLTNFTLAFTVASALIGTIIGSIAVGRPADAIGRRGILFMLAIIFFISSLGCGQALGSFTHWVMAALISWTFPMIAAQSGGQAFAFYALCCVGLLFWAIFVMPETKGIYLERIQRELGIK